MGHSKGGAKNPNIGFSKLKQTRDSHHHISPPKTPMFTLTKSDKTNQSNKSKDRNPPNHPNKLLMKNFDHEHINNNY